MQPCLPTSQNEGGPRRTHRRNSHKMHSQFRRRNSARCSTARLEDDVKEGIQGVKGKQKRDEPKPFTFGLSKQKNSGDRRNEYTSQQMCDFFFERLRPFEETKFPEVEVDY